MKKFNLFGVVCWLLATSLAFAALPQTINYQGYLTGSNGAPAVGPVSMVFSLYSSTPGRNNPVWRETQPSLQLNNGIFSTRLGSITPITAPFDVPYYLGVKVGSDSEMSLQPLSAGGYAFRAKVADSVSSSATLSGQTLAQLDSRYATPTSPVPTAHQIATMRWDQIRSDSRTLSLSASQLDAIVFDGANIWVGGNYSNNLFKINPITNIVTSVPIAGYTTAFAFDGTNLWAASSSMNRVVKINPATNAVLNTIPISTAPSSLTFDGTNIWVSVSGSNTIVKINPTNDAVSSPIPVGLNPLCIAFDGAYLWVANTSGHTVSIIDPITGLVVDTYFPFFGGFGPNSLAFDGTNMWIGSTNYNKLEKVRYNGTFTFTYSGVAAASKSLTFDGVNIWAAHSNGAVSKVNATTNAANSFATGQYPSSIAFDGANIWIAHSYPNNNVTKLAAAGAIVGTQTVSTSSLIDNAVTTAKISDGAVTSTKIAAPLALSYSTGDGKPTIAGTSASGNGIQGDSTSGTGVYGTSTTGVGVGGYSRDHIAVDGSNYSASFTTISAHNAGSGDIYQGWSGIPPMKLLRFKVANDGTLTTTGNVGIGTATPNRTLHIAHNDGVEFNMEVSNGLADWKTWNIWTSGGPGAKQNLNFRLLNDLGTASIRDVFSLQNDGNAWLAGSLTSSGIAATIAGGTAVTGTSSSSVGVKGVSTSNTGIWALSSSGIGLHAETGNNIGAYGVNNSTDAPSIEGWNKGTGDLFRGWAGAPGAQTLKFRVFNNGSATFAGPVTANGVTLTSDLRLKTDIQPLENSLAKLLNLRGVSYMMKADKAKERKIGVIAQEMEQEYPELVATDDNGIKSVAYANLTAVLIEAVKTLKTENDALKARLERLERLLGRQLQAPDQN